jgi:hypothetical protein
MMRSASIVAAILIAAAPARADDPTPEAPPRRTPFDRGRFNLSAGGGSQVLLGYRYFALGAGAGYYVLDGVEVGLSALHEFGDGPSVSKLSPSLRYVAQPLVGVSPLIPYVGGFYNHWFIGSNLADVDTVGGRVGALYVSGAIVLGLGVVYERVVSTCTMDCDYVYPDVTLAFAL